MIVRLVYDHLFAAALALSVGLHALAIWWAFGDHVLPAQVLPFRQAQTSVSLRRLTVRPEEVVRQVPLQQPPLPELPRESKIESPVKRLAAELPVPKPNLALPPTPQPRSAEPMAMAERRELPDDTPPPPKPRNRTVTPPPIPDLTAPIAEQVQDESTASAGAAVSPASIKSNPYPTFLAAYRDSIGRQLILMVHVGADGRPTGYRVEDSSGIAAADREYGDFIIANWEFNPATRGGRPIESLCPVQLNLNRRQ